MYIFGLLLSNVKVINIVIRHQQLKLIKIYDEELSIK